MAQPVVQMIGVSVAHPRMPLLPLVSGVDWAVTEGECWVIAGLQGSGKSVLLETAAGLQPCLAGEVRLFGDPLKRGAGEKDIGIRRRIGFVFDGEGRLFSSQTVFENVALPLCYHDNRSLFEVSEEVLALLALMGLESLADEPAGRLGRAWARRVALARALIMHPSLLLVDNPLSSLDPLHSRWWRSFLQQLRRGHESFGGAPMTLVLATDEPRSLLGFGDHFAAVTEGRWRSFGGRSEFEACEDPALRELLGEFE